MLARSFVLLPVIRKQSPLIRKRKPLIRKRKPLIRKRKALIRKRNPLVLDDFAKSQRTCENAGCVTGYALPRRTGILPV